MESNKLAAALLVGLVAGGMSASAHAVTFHYDGYGGFIDGTGTPGLANSQVTNDADTATGGSFDVGADPDTRNPGNVNVDVIWGTAAGSGGPYGGRSGMALSRIDDGTIDNDAGLADFGVLTHFNEPINSGTGLESIDMVWSLALFENATDAGNAEGSNNADAITVIQENFTVYNWETSNAGYGEDGYYYSTDGGTTWIGNEATGAGGVSCPNSRVDGTLVSPVSNPDATEIFVADGTDVGGNPQWNGECSDAHTFLPKALTPTTFTYDDGGGNRDYSVVLRGFYRDGNLTDTFWACEDNNCQGTVAFEILDVTADVDLGITKSVTPEPVVSGENVTYSIEVTNNSSTDEAANVVVTDTLPAGFDYVSASGGGFSCTESSGVVSCSRGVLNPGDSATLELVATASEPGGSGPHTNTAVVDSDADDPSPDNNTATADSNVIAADLGISKIDSADPVNAGDVFSYTITVNNDGTADAQNVELTDTLPIGLTYDSDDSGCNQDVIGTVTCSLGTLAVGASTDVTISVQADAAVSDQTVTNVVSVATSTTENPDNLSNNTTEDTLIQGTPIPPARNIPTLSEWAMIIMTLLLGGFGWLAVRRRDDRFSA